MELQQLEKILNACWKASATERFLLNNVHEVFTRLTGAISELEPSQLAAVESFTLSEIYESHIYVRSNLGGYALVKGALLNDSLTLAAKEMGISHGPKTT